MLFGVYVNHLYMYMTIYASLTGVLLSITQNTTKVVLYIIIITLFESQIILAEHECCTNWGDCKSNKSNQIKSNVGF